MNFDYNGLNGYFMTPDDWGKFLGDQSLNDDDLQGNAFELDHTLEEIESMFAETNRVEEEDEIRVNNFWSSVFDSTSNSSSPSSLQHMLTSPGIPTHDQEAVPFEYSAVQKRKAETSPEGYEGKRRRKGPLENPFDSAEITSFLDSEVNQPSISFAEAMRNLRSSSAHQPSAAPITSAYSLIPIPHLSSPSTDAVASFVPYPTVPVYPTQPQPLSNFSTSGNTVNSHASSLPAPQPIPARPFIPLQMAQQYFKHQSIKPPQIPQSHFHSLPIPQAPPPQISLISKQMTQAFSYASVTTHTIYNQAKDAIKSRLQNALPQIEKLDEAYEIACNAFSLGVNPNKPAGMVQDMMPYQWRGYQWMKIFWKHGLGGCLADEMGLGKTIQAIALIQDVVNEKKANGENPRILIACPANLIENWKKEIVSNTPGLAAQIQGLDSTSNSTDMQPNITIASHQKLRLVAAGKGELKFPYNQNWDLVIVDEFHGFVGTSKSQKVIKLLREKTQGADHGFFGLTGTPMPNNLKELYTLNVLLNPDIYPSVKAFNKEFIQDARKELKQLLSAIQENDGSIPDDYPVERMEEVVVQLIEMLTKPFMLRRVKAHAEFKHQTEVMESRGSAICALPTIRPEVRVSYPLTDMQQRMARAVMDGREETLNAEPEDLGVMSLFSVKQKNEDEVGLGLRDFVCLQQLSDHPSILSKSEKLTAYIEKINPKLKDLIFETPVDYNEEGKINSILGLANSILGQAPNEKVLIFTNYEQMGILLRDAFQATALTPAMKKVQFLSGKVEKSQRSGMINAFKHPAGPPVLITGRKLGTGWNCVQANHVIIGDAWWNPNDDDQCIGRIYRIGQKKLVNIYRMHQKGFIVDDRMEQFRVEKKAWCELILSSDTSNIPQKIREILGRKSSQEVA